MWGLCPASRIGLNGPVPREDVGELMEIEPRHQLRLGLAGVGLSSEAGASPYTRQSKQRQRPSSSSKD